MTDIINDYFKQFYPKDYATAWETKYGVGGCWREYSGDRSGRPTIFPAIVCVDGFSMSVQGHFGAYSMPRDDFAEHYSEVEIMCKADPILDECGGHDVGDERVYGYVPIETVTRVIATHGGMPRSNLSQDTD